MSSLRRKVFLYFLLGSAIALVLQLCFNVLLFPRFARHFEADLYQDVAPQLAQEIVRRGASAESVQEVFSQLRELNPVFDSYLLNEQGEIVGAGTSNVAVANLVVAMGPIRAALAPEQLSTAPCGVDPRGVLECAAFSVAPVLLKTGEFFVYLVVARDVQPRFFGFEGIKRLLLIGSRGFLLAAAVTLIFAWFLATYLLGELRDVAAVVTSFAKGEFRVRCRPRGNDEVSGLGASINDMADAVQERREELLQSFEEQKSWVDSLLHDLRRPIASLKLQLDSWVASGSGDYKAKVSHSLESEALILSALADTIQVRETTEGELFNLNDVLCLVVETLERAASERQVVVEMQLDQEIPPAYGRRADTHRIALNLIDNAIRYSKSGSTVFVRSSQLNGTVLFQVEDTGIGLSADERERIFDHSFRADAGREANPTGTGLGLMIVRKLLVSQGGTLRLESKQGIGTRVTCALPGQFNRIVTLADANLPREPEIDSPRRFGTSRFKSRWSLPEVASLVFLPLIAYLLFPDPRMILWTSFAGVALLSSLLPLNSRTLLAARGTHRGLWLAGGLLMSRAPYSVATVVYFAVLFLLVGLAIPAVRSARGRMLAYLWGGAAIAIVVSRGQSLEMATGGVVLLSGILLSRQLKVELFRSLRLRVAVSLFALSCLVANAQAYFGFEHYGGLFSGELESDKRAIQAVTKSLDKFVRLVDEGTLETEQLQSALAFLGACLPRTEFRNFRYDGVVQAESATFELTPSPWTPEVTNWILSNFDQGSDEVQVWESGGKRYLTKPIRLEDAESLLASATQSKLSEFVLQRVGQRYLILNLLCGWLISLIPVLVVDRAVLRSLSAQMSRMSLLARGFQVAASGGGQRVAEVLQLERGIRTLLGQIAASLSSLEDNTRSTEQLFQSIGSRLGTIRDYLASQLERVSMAELPSLIRENDAQVEILSDASYLLRVRQEGLKSASVFLGEIINAALLDVLSAQRELALPKLEVVADERLVVRGDERLLHWAFKELLSCPFEGPRSGEPVITQISAFERDGHVTVEIIPWKHENAGRWHLACTILALHGAHIEPFTSEQIRITFPPVADQK